MPTTRYHKGDLVQFRVGLRMLKGVVKEDRGPIGIGGRRLYLIEFRAEQHSDTLSEIELPAVELQRVESTVPTQ